MGSGKGSSNRVKTSTISSDGLITTPPNNSLFDAVGKHEAAVNFSTWHKHCKKNNIEDDNIVEYYLNRKLKYKQGNKSEAEYILTEMFRDVLASKSIISFDVENIQPYNITVIDDEINIDNYLDYKIEVKTNVYASIKFPDGGVHEPLSNSYSLINTNDERAINTLYIHIPGNESAQSSLINEEEIMSNGSNVDLDNGYAPNYAPDHPLLIIDSLIRRGTQPDMTY